MYLVGIPTKIMYGYGIVSELYNNLKKNALLLYSKSSKADKIIKCKNKIPIKGPATLELCNDVLDKISSKMEYIIAAGGGTVIDVAKFVGHKAEILVVTVPTIAGSGSEVTKYVVLWEGNRKLSYSGNEYYPTYSIIDPSFNVGVNNGVNLCDAISHAVESFFSKNRNQISVSYSTLVLQSSNKLNNIKCERDRCEIVSTMSVYGGAAISLASTNVCHSISYILTAKYGIPHGIASFIFLNSYIRRCDSGFAYRFNSKYKLSDFGIVKDDLLEIAEEAITYPRFDNCIVKFTKYDVLEMLEENL